MGGGSMGAIMIDKKYPERTISQPREISGQQHRTAASRLAAGADQLMYAWSMSATRATSVERVSMRSKDDCPPEVYIG